VIVKVAGTSDEISTRVEKDSTIASKEGEPEVE
jgi:hypothetical protein